MEFKYQKITVDSVCKDILNVNTDSYSESEFLNIVIKNDHRRVVSNMVKFLKNLTQSIDFEFRIKVKENKSKWIHCMGMNSGKNNVVVGFIKDVSENKKLEKELSLNEEKYRMIFETGSDGVFLVNIDSEKILEVNEAGTKLFGYSQNDLLQKMFLDLWVDPDFINATIKSQQLRVYSEMAIRSNGVNFPIDATFSYFYYNNSNVLIASIRDVSDRFESEREIIRAKEKAEESDRLKSSFLANMSHEIRTPLNAIVGFSKLLIRRNYTDEKRNVMMNEIQNNSDQLLNIINDILDISKIESNQLDIECADVSIKFILSDLYEIFKLQIENSRKNISLEIVPQTIPNELSVWADPYRMKQIFSNLLNNAVKFTSDGFIKFGYYLENKTQPIFFVADTGKGIAKANLSIIFEHFRQEEDSYTRRYGGTGLGLSISKSLVELMGGRIWVESDKGKGATFFFTLPPQKNLEPVVFEKEETILKSKSDLKNKRILLVDDVENSFYVVSEILDEYDIEVNYVNDGIKAINLLKEDANYQLILMDIQMPGLNGIETTKRIKSFLPHIPVIAQTAYALKGDEEAFLGQGMDAYISKPLDLDELVDKILKHIL
ncbi:MAG: response regulator [Bacteroidales bacterium]|nr:response regulator [Bacteroidales bacterium]